MGLKLITDRTAADMYARNEKGVYSGTDLDRVESAVEELSQKLGLELPVYTQWQRSRRIPTRQEMDRYLENVRIILEALEIQSSLPNNMEELDFEEANLIEIALEKAYKKINGRGAQ